jgi:threonine dehydrogenase-like Zn-dependent dehydrogenase
MRALVTGEPGHVEVREVPDPVAGAGQVLVRVSHCGICGSDVNAVQSGRAAPGRILGHEVSGVIAEAGRGVAGWHAGDKVAVNPTGSCGRCRLCTRGLPTQCPELPDLGTTAPGGFAELVAVPAVQLVALPADADASVGAQAVPLAVAMRAVLLAGVEPGDDVLVLGAGSIGLNVVAALRLAGAGRVLVAGRSAERLALAAALGAADIIDTRALARYAAGQGLRFAAVLECSGAPSALDALVPLLDPGGTCVYVAVGDDDVPLGVRGAVGDGVRVVGSCAFTPAVYASAVGHLVAGRVPARPLVGERLPLAAAPEAFSRLSRPGGPVGVLLRPGDPAQEKAGRAKTGPRTSDKQVRWKSSTAR